jgi:ribosome-binding factor A
MFDRHDKVSGLIQEVTATFVQQEANTDPLITITSCHVSPDYKRTTIFFTTIPEGKEEGALIFLKRNAGELRNFIKEKTRLKAIPHIEFSLDYGERHRQHIDDIVRDIESEKGN